MTAHRAFTLIELVIVVLILAVLASLLLPAVRSVLDSSRAIRCTGNLRQLGLACLLYASDGDRLLPDEQWQRRIHDLVSADPIATTSLLLLGVCPQRRATNRWL